MMILWIYDVIDVLPGTFQQFHTSPKTMTQFFHSKSSEFSQQKRRGLEEFTDWYMKYFATAKQVNPGGRTVRTVGGLI